MTENDVRARLQAAVTKERIGAFARRAQVSPQYVRQVLDAKTPPGPTILVALGLVKQTSYRYAGPKAVLTATPEPGHAIRETIDALHRSTK